VRVALSGPTLERTDRLLAGDDRETARELLEDTLGVNRRARRCRLGGR
jgi:hypothetical protein